MKERRFEIDGESVDNTSLEGFKDCIGQVIRWEEMAPDNVGYVEDVRDGSVVFKWVGMWGYAISGEFHFPEDEAVELLGSTDFDLQLFETKAIDEFTGVRETEE